MYKIGIDLAYNSVGIAIQGKTLKYASLELNQKEQETLDEGDKINRLINWLFEYLNGYIYKPHKVVIEDVFYGLNFKAVKRILRMQGAVSYKYYSLTGKKPKFRMAIQARKLVRIPVRSQKAEVQMFVIDRLELCKVSKEIRTEFNKLAYQLNTMELDLPNDLYPKEKEELKKAFKKVKDGIKRKLGKISTRIARETGITEHIADAIVLALGIER